MLSGLTPKLACQKLSVLNFDSVTCQVNEEFSLKLSPVVQDEDELQYILLQNIDSQAVQRLANSWTKQQRKQAKPISEIPTVAKIDQQQVDQRNDHDEWFGDGIAMDIDDFEYLDPADWEDCEDDDAIYNNNNDSQTFDNDGVSSNDDEPPTPTRATAEEEEQASIRNESQSDSDDDESEATAQAVIASTFAPTVAGMLTIPLT
jgi:cobalamin biosynthesis protein CobT